MERVSIESGTGGIATAGYDEPVGRPAGLVHQQWFGGEDLHGGTDRMSWVQGAKYYVGSASAAARLGRSRGIVSQGRFEGRPLSKGRVLNSRDGLWRP